MSQSNLWSRPIAPYRLATELRTNGFSTKIINGLSDYTESELVSTLLKNISSETLFVGISSTFVNSRTARGFFPGKRSKKNLDLDLVLTEIKHQFPNLNFIVGGANTAFFLASKLAKNVSLFIFGYSDLLILQIARHYKFGDALDHKLIDGQKIIWADNEKNSENISTYATKYLADDRIFENETLVLELSRGCRFKCKFCAYPMNGRKKNTFLKDAPTLTAELIYNYENFNITNYILADDTYNESIEKIEYFGKIFQQLPFKINFATYLRLDLIYGNHQSIELLRRSGLGGAFFGIESLYEPAAKAVGKGLSTQKVISTLQILKDAWGPDVNLTGSFIVGLPHETQDTASEWLSLLNEDSFPLDHAGVNPLMIGPENSMNPWKSDFQFDSSKYGYQLRNRENQKRKDASWTNENFDSELAREMVNQHYKTYFNKRFLPYDAFGNQTLKGYSLPKTMGVPQINNPHHVTIIDDLVERRALEYKINSSKPAK